MADEVISDAVVIAREWAPVATTAIVVVFGPLVVWWTKSRDKRLDAKLAAQSVKVDTAVEKVETVAAAQIVVADKVETVAVTAGVAANRALALQKEVKAGTESRTQMLGGLVAEVAEVKKIAADTLILSDGMMGNTLEIGREAAQGRYDAAPTPENEMKLNAARKRVEEHAAKERIVEAKNAGAK